MGSCGATLEEPLGTNHPWPVLVLMAMSIYASAQELVFDLAEPDTAALEKKTLWATYYHVWQAPESASGVPLRDKTDQVISGLIGERDWCMGAIEGTVLITAADGSAKTFNYVDHHGAAQVDCASATGIDPAKKPWIVATGKSRFRVAQGTYGDGVMSYKLIPYRTIAVDKATIPYGSVIYVPKARGVTVTLASGTSAAHDGFFFAADTGGAIKGNHIDVFAGIARTNPFPTFVGSSEQHTFEAFVVQDADVVQELTALHE